MSVYSRRAEDRRRLRLIAISGTFLFILFGLFIVPVLEWSYDRGQISERVIGALKQLVEKKKIVEPEPEPDRPKPETRRERKIRADRPLAARVPQARPADRLATSAADVRMNLPGATGVTRREELASAPRSRQWTGRESNTMVTATEGPKLGGDGGGGVRRSSGDLGGGRAAGRELGSGRGSGVGLGGSAAAAPELGGAGSAPQLPVISIPESASSVNLGFNRSPIIEWIAANQKTIPIVLQRPENLDQRSGDVTTWVEFTDEAGTKYTLYLLGRRSQPPQLNIFLATGGKGTLLQDEGAKGTSEVFKYGTVQGGGSRLAAQLDQLPPSRREAGQMMAVFNAWWSQTQGKKI